MVLTAPLHYTDWQQSHLPYTETSQLPGRTYQNLHERLVVCVSKSLTDNAFGHQAPQYSIPLPLTLLKQFSPRPHDGSRHDFLERDDDLVSSLTFSKSFMFRALVGETFSSDTFGSTTERKNTKRKSWACGCPAFPLGLRAQKGKSE